MLTTGFNLNYFDLVRVSDYQTPVNNNPAITTLDFGNTINAGSGNQTINGGTGIDTVNYGQLNTGINANLSTRTVTYELITNNNPLKIMPLGDSITEGYLSSDIGGYRDDLWGLLTNNGYNIDFVGNRVRGNGNFDRDHAGVSGERIDQVANRVNGLLNIYQPNAVLLMIGTNDNIQNVNFANDRSNVTFVDVFNQMGLSDLEDDVHPTPGGNNKIARSWYDAIENVYGSSRNRTTTYTDTLNSIENIIGTNYDDILVGDNNSNIFIGGGGNNIITGGGGADKFVLNGTGKHTISDFQVGEDLLVVTDGLTYGEITIAAGSTLGYSVNDTLILRNNSQQLAVLSGVQSSQIGLNSFAIA